jgi:hypothetical protein
MATGIEGRFDADDFIAELRRYLIAVDAFRAEGREPVWLREEPRDDTPGLTFTWLEAG